MKGYTRAGLGFAIGLVGCGAGSALGQGVDVGVLPGGGGSPAVVRVPNPEDPEVRRYAALQKKRLAAEKEMRRLRVEYFDNIRKTEIRQAGIIKLGQYADQPYLYPSLLKEFARSGDDVRDGILQLLEMQRTDEADTALAWTAIFDKSPEWRTAAAERLQKRLDAGTPASDRIKHVIGLGLKPGASNEEMETAATLASQFNIFEAIPLLINAQLGGGGTAAGGGGGQTGESSLGWIMIAQQVAFVSDLEPVVGDSAVAFDPTVSVVNEGTYLRIIDAHVITYRTEVHNALIGLSSRAMGEPIDFGYDQPRWAKWYSEDFKPFWEAKTAEEAESGKATNGAKGASKAEPTTGG